METLDETLRHAAHSLRGEVEQLPDMAWEALRQKQPRGPLVAVAAITLVFVVIGVPALLHDQNETPSVQSGDTPAPPTTAQQTVPTTVPAVSPTVPLVSMTVYVLENGMILEGADIHYESDGTATVFGWVGNGRSVNITTFQPFASDSPKAEDIGTLPPNPTRMDDVEFDGRSVDHAYHADDDLHTFIWWDDGAVTRMTARSFGPDLPDHLLSSLVGYDISNQIVRAMVIPEEAAALLGDGEEPLAWGTAANTTWVLVGWESVVEGKPTSTCTGVRPVAEEDWCTGPNSSFGWIHLQAFAVGDGGVLVFRTQPGVSRITVDIGGISQTLTVFGEAEGYPPTAVLPTDGSAIAGTLVPIDANGRILGDPIPFNVDSYVETPAGG